MMIAPDTAAPLADPDPRNSARPQAGHVTIDVYP